MAGAVELHGINARVEPPIPWLLVTARVCPPRRLEW